MAKLSNVLLGREINSLRWRHKHIEHHNQNDELKRNA